MSELGAAIRIVREAKGLRQSELAKAASVSAPYLSLLESGEREPSLNVLGRIAEALGVPPEALLIIAQPSSWSLQSKNRATRALADSVEKILEAERRLRSHLEEGAGKP